MPKTCSPNESSRFFKMIASCIFSPIFQAFIITKHEERNICDDECIFVILQMKTKTVNSNTKQRQKYIMCSCHLTFYGIHQFVYILKRKRYYLLFFYRSSVKHNMNGFRPLVLWVSVLPLLN